VSFFQTALSKRVSSVKATYRLSSTPAIIVDHESGAVRRMMKFVNQNQGVAAQMELPKQKVL
jgi:HSP90 family molecular chaperone